MRWRALEPVEPAFFESAPQIHRFPIDLVAAPEEVWASLASDASIGAWPAGPGMRLRVDWTSERPFGPGTTRDVRLPLGLMRLRERFFRWDKGRGCSFYAEAVDRPGFARFAEDYVVERHAGGSRLTWTIAIEPSSKAAGLAAPLNRLAFGRTAAGARTYFAHERGDR